jgi:hypothetical protein
MATQPQYDDPLSLESAPSLSFKDAPIGTTYKGVITARPKLVQSREFESGNPKTWPDGNPVMAVVILLEVDGETRSVWAQKPSALFAALVTAQKAAGAGPMEEGGELWVRFSGEEPNKKNPKLHAQKLYQCRYLPPQKQADPFDEPDKQASPARPAPTPAAKASTGPNW